MLNIEWLPELILFEDYNGDWEPYLEILYDIFKKDFIKSKLFFRGSKIHIRIKPLSEGKEFAFWHLISKGEIEEDRIPDFRRCERICWVRPIIENENVIEVKVWLNKRKRDERICLLLEKERYIVILNRRSNISNNYEYLLLLTAYYIEEDHSLEKLLKEYERYQKNTKVASK